MSLNFESPKIPLMTLAGITSLTDVLHELPLPVPHPDAADYSLFAYSTISMQGTKRLSNSVDPGNVANVVDALLKTNFDEIVLKDSMHDTDCLNGLNVPPLLQAVLARKPDIFHNKRPFVGDVCGNIKYSSPTQATTPQSPAVSVKGLPLSQASPGECASQIFSARSRVENAEIGSPSQKHIWQDRCDEVTGNNLFTVENRQTTPDENPKICLKLRRTKKASKERVLQDSPSLLDRDHVSDIRYDIVSHPNQKKAFARSSGSLKLKLSRVKTEPTSDLNQKKAFEVSSKTEKYRDQMEQLNLTASNLLSVCTTATSNQSGLSYQSRSTHLDPVAPHLPSLSQRGSAMAKVSSTVNAELSVSHSETGGQMQSFDSEVVDTNASKKKQNQKSGDGDIRTSASKPRKKNSRHVRVKFVADQEEADIYKLSDILYPDDSEISSFDELRSGMLVVAKWPQNGKMYEALVIDPLDNAGRKFRERKPPPRPYQADSGGRNHKPSFNGIGQPCVVLEQLQLPEDFNQGEHSKFSVHGRFTAYHSMADRIKLKRQQRLIGAEQGVKRSKSGSHQEVLSGSLITVDSDSEETSQTILRRPKSSKSKLERRRNAELRRLQDSGMLLGSTRKFTTVLELVLEDVDMLNTESHREGENDMISEGLLIPSSRLKDLNAESAKLKLSGTLVQVPQKSLIRLMSILEPNIRLALKLQPLAVQKDVSSLEQKWQQEASLEKVFAAINAALAALNIMTSSGMPKAVFIEDVIEAAIHLLRFQLENTIYPEYDTVYKVPNKSKGNAPNLNASSSKQKRAHYKGTKSRAVTHLYTKVISLLSLFVELLEIQPLTDTSVLQLSTVAISPFFVENVRELQLAAIRLTTTIFARYENHRRIILEDIFQSLARLPTSKRNLRSFRLNCASGDVSDEEDDGEVSPYIQMFSALILQMMQALVTLPIAESVITGKEGSKVSTWKVDELKVIRSYDNALRTGQSFLAVFLKKCASRSEEIDYRPLFENFIHDLLATVNKPEWPASEMMLSLLGRLLVHTFSNKQTEASLRTTSIDYLGVIAAKLRRDAVSSHLDENVIAELIKDFDKASKEETSAETFHEVQSNNDEIKNPGENVDEEKENEKITSFEQRLQPILLTYIKKSAEADHSLMFAHNFSIGQWLHDIVRETSEIASAEQRTSASGLDGAARDIQTQSGVLREYELKKMAILELAVEQMDHSDLAKAPASDNEACTRTGMIRKKMNVNFQLSYENATLITRYLASSRQFSHSFDTYLTHILHIREESSVAVRTRAIKCLAEVVAVDPSILAREDVWQGVQSSLVDASTSVREAAVDLVGRFILLKPDLVPQYYKMLTARILDTGVSVRKRVIKILRDLCYEHPDLPQLTDACVKMIRRVNDEEGIKKLVHEVFMNMWFTPVKSKDAHSMSLKALSIANVVAANRDIGYEWIEQMMFDLIDTDIINENVELACQQIVDCLVDHLILIEQENEGAPRPSSKQIQDDCDEGTEAKQINSESDAEPSATSGLGHTKDLDLQKKQEAVTNAMKGRNVQEMIAATMRTLVLFAKIRPRLLVPHVMTLQPHLTTKCKSSEELQTLQCVCHLLELAVPYLEHPGEAFLASLEEDLMKLILREKFVVVKSAIACLGSVTKHITHNYKLVWDCFQKLGAFLSGMKSLHLQSGFSAEFNTKASQLLRTLFITGHFMKTFDFDEKVLKGSMQVCIKDKVYDCVYYFTRFKSHEELRLFAVGALGLLMIQDPNMMFRDETKECYNSLLASKEESYRLKKQVLMNLQTYLSDEDSRMQDAAKASSHRKKEDPSTMGLHARKQYEQEQHKQEENEDIKEICEVSSGMSSSVMQVYLKKVLECLFHSHLQVRRTALNTIYLTLNQGLVHPLQCVPFIIAASTDPDPQVCSKAELLLIEIGKRYSGFIHAKSLQGIKMAYRLQLAISVQGEVTRGFRKSRATEDNSNFNKACCSQLYSSVRGDRKHRRSLMLGLLNLFDDTVKTDLGFLVFVADNLANFSYITQDEPLFVMSQIEIYVSVSGSNVLQSFKESLSKTSSKQKQNMTEKSAEQESDAGSENIISEARSPGSLSPHPDEDMSDDEEESKIICRLPYCDKPLLEFLESSMACSLLLLVKQHLKVVYGFTDNKIHRYSSSENVKANDKPVAKKRSDQIFEPREVSEYLKQKGNAVGKSPFRGEEFRQMVVKQYFQFKDLMTKLDPNEADSDSDKEASSKKTAKKVSIGETPTAGQSSNTGNETSDIRPADSSILEDSDFDSDSGIQKEQTSLDLIRKSGLSKHKEKLLRSERAGLQSVPKSPPATKELRARRKVVQYVESSESDSSEFLGF